MAELSFLFIIEAVVAVVTDDDMVKQCNVEQVTCLP